MITILLISHLCMCWHLTQVQREREEVRFDMRGNATIGSQDSMSGNVGESQLAEIMVSSTGATTRTLCRRIIEAPRLQFTSECQQFCHPPPLNNARVRHHPHSVQAAAAQRQTAERRQRRAMQARHSF
jgi:hypothetical protein